MFKRLMAINFRKPGGLFGLYIIRFLKKNQIEYDEMDSFDVVKEMEKIGFKAIETIEHTKEKKCYYVIGYKNSMLS
jgi:hypothetical protein